MTGKIGWFKEKSPSEKRWIVVGAVFFIFLFASVGYCKLRDEPTLPNYEKLKVHAGYVCDDVGGCDTKVILLKGQIVPSSISVIEEIQRAKTAGATIVCIDSPGGDGEASRSIADAIHSNELDTCVAKKYLDSEKNLLSSNAECNSACPWIVISGAQRVAFSSAAAVGFHASTAYCRLCGVTIFAFRDDSEKSKFSSNIAKRNQSLKVSKNVSDAHQKLLEKSDSFGNGPTKNIPISELKNRYSFITELRGTR